MKVPESENGNMAGWGRAVVAPGSGVIVHAEDGIPDQISPNSYDQTLFKRPDGTYAYGGNSIVIDHGNNEYSVLMHLKAGSIRPEVGDTVSQGQTIGALGNSGDSNGAHLHYHLQDSPTILTGNGLPVAFTNVEPILFRGSYVDPS